MTSTPRGRYFGWNDAPLVMLVLALSVGVGAFVYSAPGLLACHWKSEDSDFCYAMTGIRWASGMRLMYMDHPGYTVAQYLGWFYTGAAKLGVIPPASFADFAADPDPLFRIRPYVVAGWFAGFPVYAATVVLAGAFAILLTGSRRLGLAGSLMVMCSFPFIAPFVHIRPEPLSVLFGYASVFVMILACRRGGLLAFMGLAITSAALLELSLLSKLMTLPLLLFLPAVFLIERRTPWDAAPGENRRQALAYLAAANLWLAPFSLLMLKPFVPDLMKSRWAAAMALTVLGNLCVVSFARLSATGSRRARVARAGADATFLALVLLLGFQLGTRSGFIHPRLNVQQSGVAIATDIGTAMFLVAHPDTQQQYVGDLGLARIVEAVKTAVPYYLKLRPVETILVVGALIIAGRRRRIEAAWIGLFLVLGVTMLAFSSLRYIIDAYYPYEEFATILATLLAMQCWWSELAVRRSVAISRVLTPLLVTLVLAALLAPRVRQTHRLRNAISCPPTTVLAGETACVCNPAYALRTGLKGLVEKHYGDPCEEGVRWRIERGLGERIQVERR